MVWYSHPLKNFLLFVVIHTVKGFSVVNEAEVDFFFFSGILLRFLQQSSECWQFDLLFHDALLPCNYAKIKFTKIHKNSRIPPCS